MLRIEFREFREREQECEGVFPPGHPDGDLVAILDHLVIVDGASDIGQNVLYFFHARSFPPPHILY